MAKVKICETVLRDAHQSLVATRMTTEQMLPILEEMDKVGYYALEAWGGATFDACMRFLDEDPWERLRKIRDKVKNTKLQMLFRGQNILGYRHYADDVVEYFVQKSIANGIDILRIFDALNDPRNLKTAINATIKEGGHVQAAISYTTSPVHTNEGFAKYAKQLEEMGVKSMKGMHFPNSSIRAILKNITYTGNLLFQKEYTLDPISKKTRKNHGELPQYFVENTHEAIIPMETYQAVQAEIARRRELGALANWSINTSCFTSKIKCGLCGASFVRNTRKNRAKTSQLGERYTFYGCGTNKRKGEHCSSGTIREDVLKEECAKALGLPEFDEDAFSERVAKITVPATGTMLFEFTDGTSLEHHWYRNARKESWTPELRQAASEYRRDRDTGWKCYHTFTHFIKCGRCGANYRCQTHKRVDGTVVRSWYCSSPTAVGCSKVGIREDTLRALIADVMGLPEFDEELFNQQLAYATVPKGNEIVFHFRDGHEVFRTFVQKRQMPRHPEERKKHMSEVMKAKWRERHAEND